MKKLLLLLPFLLFVIAAQDAPPVAITSPASGEILRGQVNVIGSTDVPNFVSAQLDFSYASDSAGTWFPLQLLCQPPNLSKAQPCPTEPGTIRLSEPLADNSLIPYPCTTKSKFIF